MPIAVPKCDPGPTVDPPSEADCHATVARGESKPKAAVSFQLTVLVSLADAVWLAREWIEKHGDKRLRT